MGVFNLPVWDRKSFQKENKLQHYFYLPKQTSVRPKQMKMLKWSLTGWNNAASFLEAAVFWVVLFHGNSTSHWIVKLSSDLHQRNVSRRRFESVQSLAMKRQIWASDCMSSYEINCSSNHNYGLDAETIGGRRLACVQQDFRLEDNSPF